MKFKNEDASEASIRVPQNSVKCCKMLQNAAKCRKMPQNAAKCRNMPQNAAKCRKILAKFCGTRMLASLASSYFFFRVT